jgi:hypothetical protein
LTTWRDRRKSETSKYKSDLDAETTKHYFDSKFEIKTTVHKLAEWRKKLAAAQ